MNRQPQFRARDLALIRVATLPTEALAHVSEKTGDDRVKYLKELFADPYVAEAIYLASPGLHERLKAWVESGRKFEGIDKAFVRYIRRMADRATPFGTFVAIGTVTASGQKDDIHLPSWDAMRLHGRLSGAVALGLANRAIQRSEAANKRYFLNDTYFAKGDLRSLIAFSDESRKKRKYFLVDLEASAELDLVADLSQGGTTLAELSKRVIEQTGTELPGSEVSGYLDSLVECQMLVNDNLLSVTEGDLLRSLLVRAGETIGDLTSESSIHSALRTLTGAGPGVAVDAYRDFLRCNIPQNSADRQWLQADLYAGHEGDIGVGSISKDTRDRLERAASAVAALANPVGYNLADFAEAFYERYGDGEVPLMEVMNEDVGIPISRPVSPVSPLAKTVFGPGSRGSGAKSTLAPNLVKRLISDEIDTSAEYVELSSRDCRGSDGEGNSHQLNRYMLMWSALWAGPGTASSTAVIPEIKLMTLQDPSRVLGRFASGSDAIRDLISGLRIEESDQDGIAVELVHIPEPQFVNLATRRVSPAHCIAIRTAAPEGSVNIPLSDILVSVAERQVVLRSRSLSKRLLVRMSNAHNTSKEENLKVYRFLSAVSTQNSGKLVFNPRQWVGNRRYVRGLKIDGVIVSRPSWLFSIEDISRLARRDKSGRVSMLREWKAEYHLPDWVAIMGGESDIPFSTISNDSMDALAEELVSRKEVLLSELYPADMRPAVVSERGAHRHELLMVLDNFAYSRGRDTATRRPYAPSVRLVPGSEWIYFKVYVAPSRQDRALVDIFDRLQAVGCEQSFDRFFFVRYRDANGPHLRIRFHGSAAVVTNELLPALVAICHDLVHSGIAADYSINTYVKEVSRYGGVRATEACEAIFHADSKAYLSLGFDADTNADVRWENALASADTLLSAIGVDTLSDKRYFAVRASKDYASETGIQSDHRKRIGEIFRESRKNRETARPQDLTDVARALSRRDALIRESWNVVVAEALDVSDDAIYHLRWSIVHMMFNRYLLNDQRKQEAVIWDLLRREYEFKTARGDAFSASMSHSSSMEALASTENEDGE